MRMAFDGWRLLFAATSLLVLSVSEVDAQSCGNSSDKPYDVFTSPNYPNVYDINSECTYNISLPTNGSITITFETFELDRSEYDYVKITCESNSSYGQIRYPYNADAPPISFPWCSYVQIYFFSDSVCPFPTRGFKVHYQVNTIGCGNTVFNSSSGSISSPNYPQNYNKNENCTYSIWAQMYGSFTLHFEAFHLESNCRFNWVQIKCDNSSYISPKFCGSSLPNPAYITNCTKVLIWFHTDSSTAYSGFSLRYSYTSDDCGKLYYGGLSGIIISPNYPKLYTGNYCVYYVYPVSSIALDFQSFDLEPFIDTIYGDYVKIYCSTNPSYDYLIFYGKYLPPLISYPICETLTIHFSANYKISGTGFNVRYQVNPLIAHSAITNAPKNVTMNVGSRAQLNCTSNATDYYPSWTVSKDGTDDDTTVIVSFCKRHIEYQNQYDVVSDGRGVCNLVLRYATLAEAGIYTCIDVSLASASSIVTVVDPTSTSTRGQDQDDSDVIIIVLAVLLAICILGYIVIAILFTVNRYGNKSRGEEGQRDTNQDTIAANGSVGTRATGSASWDLPAYMYVFSPARPNDECRNEQLNNGFNDPL